MKQIFLLCLLCFSINVVSGQVDTVNVYSKVMNKYIPNLVITPTDYDVENDKLLWNGRLDIKKKKILELIGRMKSGLYMFSDGHLFFNNCVIKIRIDLLNQ